MNRKGERNMDVCVSVCECVRVIERVRLRKGDMIIAG